MQVEKQRGGNPAERPLVTLDNNVVVAYRNNDPNDALVQLARQLRALNRAGVITLNVTLSTALEEQRPDAELTMHEYATWLQEQGIDRCNIFTSSRTIGFRVPSTDPNTITFDFQLERALNERIHRILFPKTPFSWFEYRNQECTRQNIVGIKRDALIELDARDFYFQSSPQAPEQMLTPALDALEQTEREEMHMLLKRLRRRWMNAKNDALGLYGHITNAVHTIYPDRAVFVTNDNNFFKQTKVAGLRELNIPGRILRPADAVVFLCSITGVSLADITVE
ncbi:hypothetical protein [Ktedonobacter robiniae]|nr:hypothetical protein [Ktedonobacter robiniae]